MEWRARDLIEIRKRKIFKVVGKLRMVFQGVTSAKCHYLQLIIFIYINSVDTLQTLLFFPNFSLLVASIIYHIHYFIFSLHFSL